MRILLVGFGTRGDVQPLLALGKGLQEAGYTITLAAGSNFRELVENAGLDYALIRTDMQALMSSDSGKEWVEGGNNQLKQARTMRKMILEAGAEVGQDLLNAAQDADVLVSGLPSFGMLHAIAQHQNKQHITILFAPLTPTREHAATIQPMIPRTDTFLNRLSGSIGQYFTHWIMRDATNEFRASLGLPPLTFREYAAAYNQRLPVIYGLSPLVLPKAEDWGEQITVTGYWFYDAPADWQPSPALADFLRAGEAPVYIGFGSMTSSAPEKTARIMIEALQQTGKRGIIHSGWAGLNNSDLPDDMHLLDYAPHDWLFPQMAAVIHHGGAGTTAAALRAGVPSAVVPHMSDQPYWGRRVHELGVGTAPISRQNLTSDRLAHMIRALTSDASAREKAAELGRNIRAEDGVGNAVRTFQQLLSR